MESWKTLTRSTVVEFGRWLTIEKHTVELPDGHVISNWPWIITPDYINIVAETTEGKFLCFRQFKYAVGDTTLALVGGYLEPGEAPLACAQRELLEETGFQAAEWIALGTYRVDGNRGAGIANLFLARGAHRVSGPNADDLEQQELFLLSRAEMEDALAAGEFKVLAWAAAVALGMQYLKR